jgi:hypothetical protein
MASGRPDGGPTATAVDVFISARSDDRQPAERVHDFLTRHGLRVFLGQVTLPALGDTDYRKAIDDVLESATHLVVVATSAKHTRSRWVEHEWGSFLNEKLAGRKTGNLVTVTVGAIPERELPLGLRTHEVLRLDEDGLDRLLRYVGGSPPSGKAKPVGDDRRPRRRVLAAAACLLALVSLTGMWLLRSPTETPSSADAPRAPDPPPAASAWSGTWYDSSRDRQGRAIAGQLRLQVTAEGDVTGAYSRSTDPRAPDGELRGHVGGDGRTIEGRWASPKQRGRFIFRLAAGGATFHGFYSMDDAAPDDNAANFWNGSRDAPTTLRDIDQFSLLVQCYPSSRERAERIVGVARTLGFEVAALQVLREGQLAPRESEILFFSDASRTRGVQLQEEFRRQLGFELPVNASEYYPDRLNVGKLRINVF